MVVCHEAWKLEKTKRHSKPFFLRLWVETCNQKMLQKMLSMLGKENVKERKENVKYVYLFHIPLTMLTAWL